VLIAVAAGVLYWKRAAPAAPATQPQVVVETKQPAEPAQAETPPARTTPIDVKPSAPAQVRPPRTAVITGAEPTGAPPQKQAAALPEAAPPAPSTPAAAIPVNVPDGTRVKLLLAADVPAGAKKGDPVRMTVAQNLKIGDSLVVAEGAAVSAVIGEAGRRFPLMKRKGVPVLLDTLAAVDGTRLRLRGKVDPGASGKPVPLEAPESKDARDNQIALPRGITLDAFVDGGSDIHVKKH